MKQADWKKEIKFIKPPLLQIEAPTILCSMICILVITSGILPEVGCLLNSAVPLITTAKMLECGKRAEWEKSCILSIAVECFSEACHAASAIDYLCGFDSCKS